MDGKLLRGDLRDGGILLNLCNRILGRDRPGLLDVKDGGGEI